MIEIGKPKKIPVRTRVVKEGKAIFYAVIDNNGQPETRTVSDATWRICREPLGGQFGKDKHRKLVVGLIGVDQLVLYPSGTRQKVHVNLADVYMWALRSKAQNAQLATARERKLKLKAARIRRQIASADFRRKQMLKRERGVA